MSSMLLDDSVASSLSFSVAFACRARRDSDIRNPLNKIHNTGPEYSLTSDDDQLFLEYYPNEPKRYVVCVKDSRNSWNAFQVVERPSLLFYMKCHFYFLTQRNPIKCC